MAFDKDAFMTALDSMSVMDLNDLVKAIEEKFGVSAAAMSARASSWRWYSSLRGAAQGDRNSDKTRIAAKNGALNHRIGRRQAVSPTPEVNQTIISLSRYQRTRVSRTVT